MPAMQRVLIVDDEPMNVRVLNGVLAGVAELRAAMTGSEAMVTLLEFKPDLILLDVMMPDMDGIEACQKIRSNSEFKNTRIILVSGKTSVKDRLKGYDAGADDYITKPFIADELLAKVNVYLRLADAEKKLYELNLDLEHKVEIRSSQLLEREKQAFLGTHTAEIVHDLKNPLAILMGNLGLLKNKYPDEVPLTRATGAVSKLNDIIRTILQVSRQSNDKQVQPVDLNSVLKGELELLKAERFFKYQVQLITDFGIIPEFEGSPTHFCQCLGNLIKNAVESMHDQPKKELRISTRESADAIHIQISDTGCGIEMKNLDQLFTPFFTTKPLVAKGDEPVGTGLGLASVKNILAGYGGEVVFDSTVGVGTTVTVKLPLTKAVVEAAPQTGAAKISGPQAAPLPSNENSRLQSLRSFQILDTASEQVFDELALLASTICETPISAITFVDKDRQWFKAAVGLGTTTETSRESAFCAHTIYEAAVFTVEDAVLDPRFVGNPLVTGEPKIRFYAGAPLIDSEGHSLGAICVIDRTPRKLKPSQIACLQAISRQVMAHLEWRKQNAMIASRDRRAWIGDVSLDLSREMIAPLSSARAQLKKLQQEMMRQIQNLPLLVESSQKIEFSLTRLTDTVKSLNGFVSADAESGQDDDLGESLEAVVNLCRPRFIKAGIELRYTAIADHLGKLALNCPRSEVSALLYQILDELGRGVIENSLSGDIKFIAIATQVLDESVEMLFSTSNADSGRSVLDRFSVAHSITTRFHGRFELNSQSKNESYVLELPRPAAAALDASQLKAS